MIANYTRGESKRVKVGRKAMADYLIRASVDKQLDKRIEEHEKERWRELMAYARAVDATLLLALHKKHGFGKKRLRAVWEELLRTRLEYRLFYRDGNSYEEQATGRNAEDEAIRIELSRIGIDLAAWEEEEINIDDETGEITFGRKIK